MREPRRKGKYLLFIIFATDKVYNCIYGDMP